MTIDKLPRITSHWSLAGCVPNPKQEYPHYGANFHIGIEAQTMESALAKAREVYPSAIFISCNHRGDIHLRT